MNAKVRVCENVNRGIAGSACLIFVSCRSMTLRVWPFSWALCGCLVCLLSNYGDLWSHSINPSPTDSTGERGLWGEDTLYWTFGIFLPSDTGKRVARRLGTGEGRAPYSFLPTVLPFALPRCNPSLVVGRRHCRFQPGNWAIVTSALHQICNWLFASGAPSSQYHQRAQVASSTEAKEIAP